MHDLKGSVVAVAPVCGELLALLDSPLQTQACHPFSLFPLIARADPLGLDDAVYPDSAVTANAANQFNNECHLVSRQDHKLRGLVALAECQTLMA